MDSIAIMRETLRLNSTGKTKCFQLYRISKTTMGSTFDCRYTSRDYCHWREVHCSGGPNDWCRHPLHSS